MSQPESPTMEHAFDLKRVAISFRRSMSSTPATTPIEEEIIEKMRSIELTSSPNEQANGAIAASQDDKPKENVTDLSPTMDQSDILLDEYVEGYNELNRMFPKLGRLFSFIASDVGDKTNILSEHRLSPVGEKYKYIGGMMDYEKNEAKILDPNSPDVKNHHHLSLHHNHDLANGSRTLLRLHRAMLFVIHFIDCIRQANDADKMAHLARKAYDETLALHHPWLVRKGVHLAVHTLPSRHQLFADIAGHDVPQEEAERVMKETVDASRDVYDVVQRLYEKYGLLDLP